MSEGRHYAAEGSLFNCVAGRSGSSQGTWASTMKVSVFGSTLARRSFTLDPATIDQPDQRPVRFQRPVVFAGRHYHHSRCRVP